MNCECQFKYILKIQYVEFLWLKNICFLLLHFWKTTLGHKEKNVLAKSKQTHGEADWPTVCLADVSQSIQMLSGLVRGGPSTMTLWQKQKDKDTYS